MSLCNVDTNDHKKPEFCSCLLDRQNVVSFYYRIIKPISFNSMHLLAVSSNHQKYQSETLLRYEYGTYLKFCDVNSVSKKLYVLREFTYILTKNMQGPLGAEATAATRALPLMFMPRERLLATGSFIRLRINFYQVTLWNRPGTKYILFRLPP